jgi:hypothetical protein
VSNDKRAADDAIEYAIQILSQVEAGDGVFVGDCSKAIKGLSAALSSRADGGKDSSDARDMADFIAEDGLLEQFRIWRECRDAAIAREKK